MIKFTLNRPTHDGHQNKLVIGFGLSEANIKKLKQGHPILIDLMEMGIPYYEVLIMYGKTEQEMAKQLGGLVGPNTIIHESKMYKKKKGDNQ